MLNHKYTKYLFSTWYNNVGILIQHIASWNLYITLKLVCIGRNNLFNEKLIYVRMRYCIPLERLPDIRYAMLRAYPPLVSRVSIRRPWSPVCRRTVSWPSRLPRQMWTCLKRGRSLLNWLAVATKTTAMWLRCKNSQTIVDVWFWIIASILQALV